MDDDFFDNTNNKNHFSPQDGQINHDEFHQEIHHDNQQFDEFFAGNESVPQDTHAIDDFFGNSAPIQQQPQSVIQNNFQNFDDNLFNNSSQFTSQQQQQPTSSYDMFGTGSATPQQLTEVDERKMRLKKEEQERTNLLIKKQNEENILKNQRIAAAKAYLSNWKSEKEANTGKRKQACLQEEEVLIESRKNVTYKNSWDKITENISLKASDYPGAKDVSRMKESIMNKKADLANAKN